MPTYEYKCKNCGYAFEKFHSITSAPIKKCPQCGKNTVERLISAGGGLIFKGSGFYITDYRDQSYTDKAKADSATPEKPDAPAKTAEADAKPAAAETKAETKSESNPKSEPKSESTPAPKPDPKPAKSEPKPQAKSSSRKK